ncbi:MAG: glycogen phosphorylase, partial [Anaerolinea sp.]|nr:glycogen phosphorylase [Anaerolinea sp.]
MSLRHVSTPRPAAPSTKESDLAAPFLRRLILDHAVSPDSSTPRQRFVAISLALRDAITPRWLETGKRHEQANPKRVYYLSMEFLIGRTLLNNVVNLRAEPLVEKALGANFEFSWRELIEEEPDAGLGNGGLGRLAACFIDSLATLHIPAMGYGLRYDYGIFRQSIEAGRQVEHPDHWLTQPDPWEVVRPDEAVRVPIGCQFHLDSGVLRAVPGHPSELVGVPYDR